MSTNHEKKTNMETEILEKDLCYKIQGCVYNVANKYGSFGIFGVGRAEAAGR